MEFRKMRRAKQELAPEICKQVLTDQWRGTLALLGDGGYPYAVPLDFLYDEEAGAIYFHCAVEGHKIDAVRSCDKACFNVLSDGEHKAGHWSLYFNSVTVFGRISLIEDRDRMLDAVRRIGEKYMGKGPEVDADMARNANRVACLELKIEHMSGKRVHES